SYELSLGLSVIPIFMLCRTLNLPEIVRYQIENGWLISPIWIKGISLFPLSINFQEIIGSFDILRILLWIPVAISFVVFTISMFAETNRLPFDLPEAEQELVGGYHTEYSSMKFSLIVTLFLGGWHFPGIPDGAGAGGFEALHAIPAWFWGLVNIAVFFGKVAVLLLFFIWVRWTLPRFRYDQLMRLGWLFFFEIALVNVFLAAVILAV